MFKLPEGNKNSWRNLNFLTRRDVATGMMLDGESFPKGRVKIAVFRLVNDSISAESMGSWENHWINGIIMGKPLDTIAPPKRMHTIHIHQANWNMTITVAAW